MQLKRCLETTISWVLRSVVKGNCAMRSFVCMFSAVLAFAVGCGRPAGLPEIENLLAEHRVIQMVPGDPVQIGVSKTIQVNQYWHDFPQTRDENGDGNLAYCFSPQVGMSVESIGNWKTITESIHDSLEFSAVSAEELLRHRDDRVRFATYYALGQYGPISDHFPNSSPEIVKELARIASGGDVYEAAAAIELLGEDDVYCEAAFSGAVRHPCAQIRLAALGYLDFAGLTDEQKKNVLPHLVACLGDRDSIVRQCAYGRLNRLLQDSRTDGELPDDLAALIATIPHGLVGGAWYEDISRPIARILCEDQREWNKWLASHEVDVAE